MSALEVTPSMPGPLWSLLFCLAFLALVAVLVLICDHLSRPSTQGRQWLVLLGTGLFACVWVALLVLAALTSGPEQDTPGVEGLGGAW
ncbi:hypothetical protein [Cellulomonas triticagri]|uniref:Uncharacterized protein n=1 Tax=Cellulomonas triticagri TaxID=2483352 RepID=A0A3M2JC28_9CELL|nr:hypothetical protein [Cellulomonas triticagri]RMI09390.1 hypothetical protein EBM89_10435 [Cellulomonas triticagri]